MTGRWPFTAEKVAARIKLIAPYIHRRRQPIEPFRLMPLAEAMVNAPICNDPTHWDEIAHESYWGHADLNFVLKSGFVIPEGWDPDRLALHLPLGVLGDIFNHPEALVHIDTHPIGSADRYHHTLPLPAALADGARHVLSLHGWTGHAGWPPDPASKAKLYMGTPAVVERDPDLLAFVRLAQACLDTLSVLDPDGALHANLLQALDRAVLQLDTRDPIGAPLYASVPAALASLQDGIAAAGAPLDVTLHGIGHAHMDIAYLWPVSQIRLKNARTYSNVLRLMETHPDFHFSHSQPQLYAFTAQDYPALFDQIKARVAEGRWEVMGGMWVEPDLNIPGPESLVRQLTLGRRYFRDQFGDVETPVLWLPDTFGFPAQIPQLMKLAGLRWFVTNKLNWNQRNKVPSSSHHWTGLDGSCVLAHVLTTPRDVQYLPFPTNYKSDLSAYEVLGTWTRSTAQDSVRDLPICFGYGDGGGGPTEDLLAKADAYAAMPGMPRLRLGTVREALERIEAEAANLPYWVGEHYMEGHRGVFTSQGWIKRANRKAEWALHEAEALCVLAGIDADLTEAWQLLCLNQFHDIITGTSVAEVFADARKDFDRIAQIVQAATARALAVLDRAAPSVISTAPMGGAQVVFVPGPGGAGPAQTVPGGQLHLIPDLPAYGQVPLSRSQAPDHPVTCTETADGFVLENAFVRACLSRGGQLMQVIDKTTARSVLADGQAGNVLQAFEDRPICWDAWDIDPSFEDRMEVLQGDTTCEVLETGPIRAALRFSLSWRSSRVVQTVRLSAASGQIVFDVQVDWHEQHTLLKVAFPTAIPARQASFDVQWGHVVRSTARDTAFDAARFEVPAQKWAMVKDDTLGVAVLNDCKYGYDVHGGVIRLTLIKSATSPDPGADQGDHRFSYALFAAPDGAEARVQQAAYALNAPLRLLPGQGQGAVPDTPFLRCDGPAVVETVKPAEDGQGVILRLFDASGEGGTSTLRFAAPPQYVKRVDLFEAGETLLPIQDGAVTVPLGRFEILSLRVQFA